PVDVRCSALSCVDTEEVARIRVCDGGAELMAADGRRLGHLAGLAVSAADGPSSVWWPEDQLRYVLDWRPAPSDAPPVVVSPHLGRTSEAASTSLAGRGFLVLSDRRSTADGLAAELGARGATVLVADPPSADGIGPLLESWAADCPHGTDVLVLTGL